MNYSSGDLNFIREIKLNEITEKIIRDLLRVDPSHRANSFIIRNGQTCTDLGGTSSSRWEFPSVFGLCVVGKIVKFLVGEFLVGKTDSKLERTV